MDKSQKTNLYMNDDSPNLTLDTIFALASPYGQSGVAVIRVSGSQCDDITKQITQQPLPSPNQMALRRLYHPTSQMAIDRCLVVYFASPKSFTGEDVVEFHTHGSIAVIEQLLDALGQCNARLAEPGEFSRRAYENGKMDLTEAEGLADLIHAETKTQLTQALHLAGGNVKQGYEQWREQLLTILAHLEAYIDFPDEDIPASITEQLENEINQLRLEFQQQIDLSHASEHIREGLSLAIVGVPNAGKSSLLNALCKRDVAIVSAESGTTRDVIETHFNFDGYLVKLSDTAGLREALNSVEKEGIRRARDLAQGAQIKLLVIDASQSLEIQSDILSLFDERSLLVLNKTDVDSPLLSEADIPHPIISISVTQGQGLPELIDQISQLIRHQYPISDNPMVTRTRHRQLLQQALVSLNDFSLAKPIELAADDLYQTANALARITGHIDVDDILDRVFSEFCIGK